MTSPRLERPALLRRDGLPTVDGRNGIGRYIAQQWRRKQRLRRYGAHLPPATPFGQQNTQAIALVAIRAMVRKRGAINSTILIQLAVRDGIQITELWVLLVDSLTNSRLLTLKQACQVGSVVINCDWYLFAVVGNGKRALLGLGGWAAHDSGVIPLLEPHWRIGPHRYYLPRRAP